MKIRIFTLAKELDMDSKVLIEHCLSLGIELKNSALASISPEEKEQVLAYIKQGAQSSDAGRQPLAPVREQPRVVTGKVPQIKSAAPRQQPSAEGQKDAPAAEHDAGHEEQGDVEVASDSADATSPEEAEVEEKAVDSSVSAEADSLDTGVAAQLPPPVVPAPSPVAESTDGPGAAPASPAADRPNSGPLRREDYVPASGTTLRAMISREMPSDTGPRAPRRQKGRPGPSLPKLAEAPPAPKAAP